MRLYQTYLLQQVQHLFFASYPNGSVVCFDWLEGLYMCADLFPACCIGPLAIMPHAFHLPFFNSTPRQFELANSLFDNPTLDTSLYMVWSLGS